MPDYVEYFLNSNTNVMQYETVEIDHPSFSSVLRVVRNASDGLSATLEDGSTAEFEYYPMKVSPVSSVGDDLDQTISITFGDLGEVLPKQLDSMSAAGTMHIHPVLKYRVYRSDDLSAPMLGPIELLVQDLSFSREGATFEAAAKPLNSTSTGELYTIERFATLRGFI